MYSRNSIILDKKTSVLYAAATNYKKKSISNVLPNIIGQVLKPMGRYQWAVIFIMAINGGIVSFNHALPSFHTFTPKFRCMDNENGTFSRTCTVSNSTCSSGFEFSNEDHTIVSEWSLVCSKLFLGPMANTIYYAGVTIGSFICGIISDVWGRKKTIWLCLYGQGILGLVLIYSPNLYWFIGIRAAQGFFVQGLQGVAFTLLLEYSPPQYRTVAGIIWEIGWATGLLFLGMVSYFVRDWHMLQVYLTIPTAISLLYAWAIPESMFWLFSANKRREAFEQCKITAKYNGSYELIQENEKIIEESLKGPECEDWMKPMQKNAKFTDMFASRALRKHLFIALLIWYAIMLVYYSPLFFLPKLEGDRHLNYILMSSIEFIAFAIAFVLLEKLGRRKTMTLFQYICGLFCLVLSIIFVYVPDNQYHKEYLTIGVALMVKLTATSLGTGLFLYTTELFPTTVRGAAFGICGFSSRVGTLTAPFLMVLLFTYPLIPMTVVGAIVILSGTFTMLLPETLNRYSPNTIAEAREIWENNKVHFEE